MKNLIFVLLIFVATVCSAQVALERDQNGEFRAEIAQSQKIWAKSEIVAEEGAMIYIQNFPEAIANPGIPILVAEKGTKREIVYDESKKTISLIESSEEKEDSPYLMLYVFASLFFMFVSNMLFSENEELTLMGFLAAFSTIAAVIVSLITVAYMTISLFAALSAFIATLSALFGGKKSYKIFSATYYVLMTIYVVMLFII